MTDHHGAALSCKCWDVGCGFTCWCHTASTSQVLTPVKSLLLMHCVCPSGSSQSRTRMWILACQGHSSMCMETAQAVDHIRPVASHRPAVLSVSSRLWLGQILSPTALSFWLLFNFLIGIPFLFPTGPALMYPGLGIIATVRGLVHCQCPSTQTSFSVKFPSLSLGIWMPTSSSQHTWHVSIL